MTMAARPNRLVNYSMPNSTDKATNPIGSSFTNPRWKSTDNIWGNAAVISNGLGTKRETAGSRGSDETSPTGPSGSAQLNPSSEAVPWSRNGIWTSSTTSAHKPSASGSASPTRLRDFHEMTNGSPFFNTRAPLGQNGTSFPTRQKPTTNIDATNSAPKYPVFGESVVDSADTTGLYETISAYRRNSSDPAFASLAPNRQGSIASRQTEVESSLIPNQFGDTSQFPFSQNPSNHVSFHAQRPSVNGHSMSFPTETTNRSRVAPYAPEIREKDLVDNFRAMMVEEAESVINGYATNGVNGLPNPASQPFQFNPSSSPWPQEPANPRYYGAQDNFMDQMSGPYYHPKTGSSGGGSPAGNGFRSNLNGPKAFRVAPNPRAEPWSKPIARDTRMFQDTDRQPHASPQYLAQPPPPYHSSQYYNPAISSFPPFDQPFNPNPHFRPDVPVLPYVPPMQVPFRPMKDQDFGKGVRSLLLEDFRGIGRPRRYELKDIYEHVVEFSGDQHGSRFIQDKLQTANSDEKEQVFREIEPNAIQLMKDVFGNYVIQKFFEHGNQVQKKILAGMMKGKIAELSTQMYACRVVQKALEHVLIEQQAEIVEELKQKIVHIVKDSNGNHVVQKVIQMFPKDCIPSVMNAFRGQIDQLAAHNYGCRVIQRLLEHGTEEEKRELMGEIHNHANLLISDQFGNYVAQHIIAHGEPDDRSKMIEMVTKNLVHLSKHKFASNVVEKCIEHGDAEQRRLMQAQLMVPTNGSTSPIQLMIKDQFGNYVIQKMLKNLSGPELLPFVKEVAHQCDIIRKQTGNNRQVNAIDQLTNKALQGKSNGINGRPTVMTNTAPSSPSTQADGASTVPTPSLTTEDGSPKSSGPPSTDSEHAEDTITDKAKPSSEDDQPSPITCEH